MSAQNNEVLTTATKILYQYNSDWLIRERCRAREDYERHEKRVAEELAEKNAMLEMQSTALSEKDATIEAQADTIEKQQKDLAEMTARIAALEAQLAKSTNN